METYDRLAASYDARHANPWTEHMRKREKPFLRMVQGKVLDIGCGTGYHMRLFPGAVGLDCSEGMLNEAKKRGTAVKGRAENLPFADGEFDSALCMFTVLNQCDPARAAAEMSRVLARGGVCIVSVASIYDRNIGFLGRLRMGNAQRQKAFAVGGQKVRLRLFDKGEIERLFHSNGFSTERFSGAFILASPRWGDPHPLTNREKAALLVERLIPGGYGALYIFAFRKR